MGLFSLTMMSSLVTRENEWGRCGCDDSQDAGSKCTPGKIESETKQCCALLLYIFFHLINVRG